MPTGMPFIASGLYSAFFDVKRPVSNNFDPWPGPSIHSSVILSFSGSTRVTGIAPTALSVMLKRTVAAAIAIKFSHPLFSKGSAYPHVQEMNSLPMRKLGHRLNRCYQTIKLVLFPDLN